MLFLLWLVTSVVVGILVGKFLDLSDDLEDVEGRLNDVEDELDSFEIVELDPTETVLNEMSIEDVQNLLQAEAEVRSPDAVAINLDGTVPETKAEQ